MTNSKKSLNFSNVRRQSEVEENIQEILDKEIAISAKSKSPAEGTPIAGKSPVAMDPRTDPRYNHYAHDRHAQSRGIVL